MTSPNPGGIGSRAVSLEKLAASSSEPFDLLVVGGGITGAGIALDASSRGLKVALVERSDFAAGTSSKSSKLVHGGLRYLEQKEFGLVCEKRRPSETSCAASRRIWSNPSRSLFPSPAGR
ncbi:MAG: FAD-dependent oxidoreductase [Actinobacteria bacterium]|nr:FAD-dependent oxidoreductase [Actinomycetota bacterium]